MTDIEFKDGVEHFQLSKEKGHKNLIGYSYAIFEDEIGWDKELSILDVGSGDGWFQTFMNKKGFNDVKSISLNKEDVKAGKKEDLDIKLQDVHKMGYDKEFDIVWCRHVLEHCVSPYIALKRIKEALKKDGHLILILPESNKNLIKSETHLYVLNPAQLKTLLEKTGFKMKVFYSLRFDKTDKVSVNTWNEYFIVATKSDNNA